MLSKGSGARALSRAPCRKPPVAPTSDVSMSRSVVDLKPSGSPRHGGPPSSGNSYDAGLKPSSPAGGSKTAGPLGHPSSPPRSVDNVVEASAASGVTEFRGSSHPTANPLAQILVPFK